MRYTSTRDKSINVSFEEALTSGYASDGGLFVPQTLPTLTPATLHAWIHGLTITDDDDYNSGVDRCDDGGNIQSYSQLLYTILRMFIDPSEIPNDELRQICHESVAGFDDPMNCIPVIPFYDPNTASTNHQHHQQQQQQQQSNTPSFYVAELFHGPTFCFKDLGMRTVIHLLYRFAQRTQPSTTTTTLLVSTTGDTGPAAAQTIHDINDPIMNIIVHYPHEQISAFQQQQLVSTIQSSSGDCSSDKSSSATGGCKQIELVAFHGGGDDMDLPIKNLLASKKKKSRLQMQGIQEENHDATAATTTSSTSLWTGVNSYNIGRPITQIVLYIWTYICIARDRQWTFQTNDDDKNDKQKQRLPMIDIVLPTGAMGNIVAGYMSQRMGLPIRTLVAAVNMNDIMYQTINNGTFQKSTHMQRTLSEAINIQIPYNFERMIYYITNENDVLVQDYYHSLDTTGKITLPLEYLQKIQAIFRSARVTDDQMCDAIRFVYETYDHYMIDPHTAVAFSAAFQLQYIQQISKQSENNKEQRPDEKNDESQPSPSTSLNDSAPNTSTTTVILATASPCKFEHSVSTAVGTTIWDSYVNSTSYPERAKHIYQQTKVSSTSNSNCSSSSDDKNRVVHHYTNPGNVPLSEIQTEWEERTRQLIQQLERNERL